MAHGRRTQTTTTILSAGAAIAAAAIVAVLIAAIIFVLAAAWGNCRYKTDPTFGACFGWGMIIAAPLMLAADLGLSIGLGVVIFQRLKDRQWRGDERSA
jgi:hypothetical protein